MYDSHRRPYQNRSENLLQNSQETSPSFDSNRFWKLLKNLRRKQRNVRVEQTQDTAKSS